MGSDCRMCLVLLSHLYEVQYEPIEYGDYNEFSGGSIGNVYIIY